MVALVDFSNHDFINFNLVAFLCTSDLFFTQYKKLSNFLQVKLQYNFASVELFLLLYAHHAIKNSKFWEHLKNTNTKH